MGTKKEPKGVAIFEEGPWSGGTGAGDEPWTLTSAELRAYFTAIQGNLANPSSVLGCQGSDRKVDRANHLLRKAGLIVFSGKGQDRRWRSTLTAGTFL